MVVRYWPKEDDILELNQYGSSLLNLSNNIYMNLFIFKEVLTLKNWSPHLYLIRNYWVRVYTHMEDV